MSHIQKLDLEINRGTVFSKSLIFRNGDGTPKDIRTWGVRWLAAPMAGDSPIYDLLPVIVPELDVDDELINVRVIATLDGDATRAMIKGNYTHDLVLTPPPGTSAEREGPYLRGNLKISHTVSANE